jgi:DNA-binding CsgD family transcriptional regulator
MSETGLSELVAEAFESACNPADIPAFLSHTIAYFGAERGAMVIWTPQDESLALGIGHNLSKDRLQLLFEDRHEPESVFNRISELNLGDTAVLHNEAHFSGTIVVGLITDEDGRYCAFILQRCGENAEFSLPEHETLQTLLGYVRRAIYRNMKFIRTLNERDTAMNVINNSPRAIIVFGQQLQPTIINIEAQKILAKNDGIAIAENAMHLDDEQSRDQLGDFLNSINASDGTHDASLRLRLSIPNRYGNMPYQMVVYATPTTTLRGTLNNEESIAVAIIYDPDNTAALKPDVLNVYYNLTTAEARLATELYAGNTLPEVSKILNISINTARTQLRNVFRKVGVNSQAALLQEFAQSMKENPSASVESANVINIKSRNH